MSSNRWMGTQILVYLYNGILFSCRKEWSACYNMDEPENIMLSETGKKFTCIWFFLYKIFSKGKKKQKSDESLLGGGGTVNGEW